MVRGLEEAQFHDPSVVSLLEVPLVCGPSVVRLPEEPQFRGSSVYRSIFWSTDRLSADLWTDRGPYIRNEMTSILPFFF